MVAKRLNEEFISILSELDDIMTRQGEPFRAKAYREGAEAIMNHVDDITDPNQLKGTFNIGKSILSKLNEYATTGTLELLERERKNPLNQLTKVYGIGPKKAKELIDKGITSIAQLKYHQDLLTDNMKTGFKYFDDIEARIPRSEIDEYKIIVTKVFNESTPSGSTFEIVGSYRRGAATSGDIDMIITNDENNENVLNYFLDALIKKNMIIEVLSRGQNKSLTIGQIPGHRPRRLDFLYALPSEYSFAILYFTGSKTFNINQRQRALNLGLCMDERGLYTRVSGKKVAKINCSFPTEKSIFSFLGMEYREPADRVDGRSVALLNRPPIADPTDDDLTEEEVEPQPVLQSKKTSPSPVSKTEVVQVKKLKR